jgi:DNA-binding MarR family transcriptional regulator
VRFRSQTIDEVLEAWRRERPDLEFAPKEISLRLRNLARQLGSVDRASCDSAGLPTRYFGLLAALRRSGVPFDLTPTQLCRDLRMTSGGLTNLLDSAEREGWIERRNDPKDGRVVHVRPTARGRRLIERAVETQLEREAELLACLSKLEQATLARLLAKVIDSQDDGASS